MPTQLTYPATMRHMRQKIGVCVTPIDHKIWAVSRDLLKISPGKVAPVGAEMAEQNVPRKLAREELEKLQKEDSISEFKRDKLETDARKNWDLFYKRNSTNFFKDRHWLTREFPELIAEVSQSSDRKVLLEAGCGVGNTLFPLLEDYKHLFIYACDFSPRAIEFVKSNPQYRDDSCMAFQCDLTDGASLGQRVPPNSVDLVSLIFVLSAVNPAKFADVILNLCSCLKPGGGILFRDYGLYDHAMLRFGRGHKIAERFYARQDGTRAYFFATDELDGLFRGCGLEVQELAYVHRETVNRKEDKCAPRVFVQAKLVKARPLAEEEEGEDTVPGKDSENVMEPQQQS